MTLHSYDENWVGNCRVCGAIPGNPHSSSCPYCSPIDKKIQEDEMKKILKDNPIKFPDGVVELLNKPLSNIKVKKRRCRNIKCSKLITLEEGQEACYSCGTLFVELPEKPAPLWDEFGMTIEKDGDESKGVPPRGGGI